MAGQIGHKHFLTSVEVMSLKGRGVWGQWCESAWYTETRGLSTKVPFEVHEIKDDGTYHNITSEAVATVARRLKENQQ